LNRIAKLVGCALAAMIAVPLCAHADIYRFVDENGTVHFSNIPSDARFKLYMATKKNEPDAVTSVVASRVVHSYPTAARSRFHAHIVAAARTYQLEPALLHAVISAESGYNPLARSAKGARGLMQLMPPVGKDLAAAQGIGPWDPDMLYEPATNIKLGTAHLKGLVRKYTDVVKILAAYNAGESRVAKWSTKTGAGDSEVFTERIPFVETRDYVRTILRNRAYYQALYSW